jgi:hypothetical protein
LVDHFIPWSRHPDNGIHNLVAAHPSCNHHKRDSMAAIQHLTRWIDRNLTHGATLAQIAAAKNWPTHPTRTDAAANASYRWLPDGASLWLMDWNYEPLNRPSIVRALAALGEHTFRTDEDG